jgi:hypothetical protein
MNEIRSCLEEETKKWGVKRDRINKPYSRPKYLRSLPYLPSAEVTPASNKVERRKKAEVVCPHIVSGYDPQYDDPVVNSPAGTQ